MKVKQLAHQKLMPLLLSFLIIQSCNTKHVEEHSTTTSTLEEEVITFPLDSITKNMVWIEGGVFTMGTDEKEAYEAEKPAHQVSVSGFWMDTTEVTNLQYKAFVDATGYVTVAEKKPDWEELKKQLPPGSKKPSEEDLVPASLVFSSPMNVSNMQDISQWWRWVPGASWKHPEGPESSLEGRWNHPVVQLAYEDVEAYATWAGKRIPTEAEWEYAARGTMQNKRYAWGDDFLVDNKHMANTFQGKFPMKNTKEDGYLTTSPVASFPPNDFGLYDMIGNVWEWTSDWYDANAYKKLTQQEVVVNPKGAAKCYDPDDAYAIKRVRKGGSFLCSVNYCINYRPSARDGQAYDSGASNVGFRCVYSK